MTDFNVVQRLDYLNKINASDRALKGIEFKPGRCCKKKTLPLFAIASKKIVIRIIGDSTINKSKADQKSAKGLTIFLYLLKISF